MCGRYFFDAEGVVDVIFIVGLTKVVTEVGKFTVEVIQTVR
jgi:hypothetical protein